MRRCVKFILFRNYTLHVSDGLYVQHQELKTVIQQKTFVNQILLSASSWVRDGTLNLVPTNKQTAVSV